MQPNRFKPISRADIEPYREQAEKEHLSFIDGVDYYGAYIDASLVGFCGIKRYSTYALSKSIFVLPAYRQQGIGRYLVRCTLKLMRQENKEYVMASCISYSLPIFLSFNAQIVKQYKHGAKVKVYL